MRLGIVGTNFISDRIAEAAVRIGITVSAVYSRTEDSGRTFASRHGIDKVYTDLDAMLLSGDIDALYVASPTMCHLDHTIAAVHRHIPVLCEKMLVATAFEANILDLAVASDRGKVVEAMRPAFDERHKFVKDNLHKLGAIRRARLEYCQYSSRYDAFLRGEVLNAFDPKMKNSALADIGIYPLYTAVMLFGEPNSVSADGTFLSNGFLGEGTAVLDYGSFSVEICYSKIREGENVSLIEGEMGKCEIGRMNEPDFARFTMLDGRIDESIRGEGESNFDTELTAFADIVNGAPCDELWQTSLSVMRVVGMIYSALGINFDDPCSAT
jgi:predicted dehydrogenase